MAEHAGNMDRKIQMTRSGYNALKDELEDLKVNKLHEIADKIKEAREQGDLSENAEYDAAKEEQAHIVARIEEIQEQLKYAEVADEGAVKKGQVSLGSRVKVLDVEMNEEEEYRLVGTNEADSLEGKISTDSPLGKELLGKKKGQTITVETPMGPLKYKIVSVATGQD